MNHALIVMLHYIWPDDEPAPAGIRPLGVSELSQQIDWLRERYDIVGAEEFLSRYREPSLRRPPCLLTFDDGTRDHAETVTPFLAERGLTAVFFVLSGPAARGLMPLTHAVHWLLGEEPESVWAAFERYARDHRLGDAALGARSEAERVYHYEPSIRARIKYAANMALPPEHTEVIVRQLVESKGTTMGELAARWFASPDQLVAMHRAGMTIGMHGVTHRSLQVLGPAGIREEIAECARYFRELLGAPPTWWACPFGGSGAPPATLRAMDDALRASGVYAAVSTRAASVAPADQRLSLPRIDAVNLPPRSVRIPEEVR